MSDVSTLANIGDLTKPASTLIEKASEALGGIFKPQQIVRIAKAEAEAAIIKAEAEGKVNEIRYRALQRLVHEEEKRQLNIESVLQQAIPLLEDNALPQDVEDDWYTHFFESARIISDKELQSLWARILAGEANTPGAFAKRTLNILANIEKEDATVFTRLCGFNWNVVAIGPLIFEPEDLIYKQRGITFDSLYDLAALNLIQFNPVNDFMKRGGPNTISVSYFERSVSLTFPSDSVERLRTGKVLLTRAGRQLSTVVQAKPVDGFFEYVYEKWSNEGLISNLKPEQKAHRKKSERK